MNKSISDVLNNLDEKRLGEELHHLIEELYPICRSITGDGTRQTLRKLGNVSPLSIIEVPSGTTVLDWKVPQEWNIRGAVLKGPGGNVIADFKTSSLRVVNYSTPVRGTFSLEELRPHLYSDPDRPKDIPYRTSYYKGTWGFCLPHEEMLRLPQGTYEVDIDSTLAPGSLSYGESILRGEQEASVLISTHICHPSLCNDNLSGMAVAIHLARLLSSLPTRLTYRFVFVPGTIGALAWLAQNREITGRIKHGLVLACVGDAGSFHYKRSRSSTAFIDRAAEHVIKTSGHAYEIREFDPYGYDERQYCSPGFDLPVGAFSRTPHGEYPEYHTSADDLTLVTPEALAQSLRMLLEIVHVVEEDRTYVNASPYGEPQLGRRGLYGSMGGGKTPREDEYAMLWVLNQSDGLHSLLDVAVRSSLPFRTVARAAHRLREAGLLQPKNGS